MILNPGVRLLALLWTASRLLHLHLHLFDVLTLEAHYAHSTSMYCLPLISYIVVRINVRLLDVYAYILKLHLGAILNFSAKYLPSNEKRFTIADFSIFY